MTTYTLTEAQRHQLLDAVTASELDDVREVAEKMLQSLAPMAAPSTSQWQPIETAPKPSGRVLLSAEGETCYGHWYSTYNRWEYDGYEWGNPKKQPTHWMPLPPPPIKGGA